MHFLAHSSQSRNFLALTNYSCYYSLKMQYGKMLTFEWLCSNQHLTFIVFEHSLISQDSTDRPFDVHATSLIFSDTFCFDNISILKPRDIGICAISKIGFDTNCSVFKHYKNTMYTLLCAVLYYISAINN